MADSLAAGALWRLRWPLIIGLPLLTAALAYMLFTPMYQTNDDVAMLLFAAGVGLSPEPSPYLLFMNPLPGQFLSTCYRLWPDMAWYSLFLMAVRMLAGMALGVAVLARKPSAVRVLLLGGYFLTVDLVGHVRPQFSLAAAAAAQGAILLWLSRSIARPWGRGSLTAFLGLLGLAVAVRPDHAVLVVVLTVPLGVVDALAALWGHATADGGVPFRARLRAWAVRTGFPFLAAAGVVAALIGYHHWFYAASPGWRHFYSYNWLRAQVTDFGCDDAAPGTEIALHRVGWSRNDLVMLRRFFFADREIYSAARLQAFLEAYPRRPLLLEPVRARLEAFSSDPLLWLALVAALFPALFLPARTWPRYGGVCAAAAAVWLLAVGVAHHYCPPHFTQALLAFVGAVGVALAGPIRSGVGRFAVWTAGTGVLAFAVLRAADGLQQGSRRLEAASAELRTQLRAFSPQPDRLYVVWGSCFPFEYLRPFDSLSELRRFKMFGLGCVTNTPLTDKRLEEFGLPDVVTGLYTRDNVFLVCVEGLLPFLQTYIAEHRGIHVEAHPVFDRPGGLFKVFQIRPRVQPRGGTEPGGALPLANVSPPSAKEGKACE